MGQPFFDEPPFPRGTVAGDGTATFNPLWEGRLAYFDDINYGATGAVKPLRSRIPVLCMCCRNSASGVALPAKRLVVLGCNASGNITNATNTAGPNGFSRAIGLARIENVNSFPVDEWLPATIKDASGNNQNGVPENFLFWLVLQGPAVIRTSDEGTNWNADIVVGDPVTAVTATTATATNIGTTGASTLPGGRIMRFSTLAATTGTTTIITALENLYARHGIIGRAMTAKTTAQTNNDVLVNTIARW